MRWERIGDELVVLDAENGVVHRVPSESVVSTESELASDETSRRRMLAMLAAGSVAGVTTLALPSVAAASSGGLSGSGGSDTTIPTTPTAPDAPASLTPSAETNTTLTLTWSPVADVSSYKILYRTGSSGPYSVLQSGVAATTYAVTGLTSNTLYEFVVRSVKDGTESADSPAAPATTTNHSSLSAPSSPTVTLDESDPTALTVTWLAVEGATSYELWQATGSDPLAKSVDPAASPVVASGLATNTTYRYAVKARNPEYASDLSEEGSLLTPPASPDAPIFGSVTTSAVEVQWSAVTGATGYEVFARTGSGAFASKGTTSSTSLTVGLLSSGTSYDFRVAAINEGGSSLPSSDASTVTLPSAPSAPSLGSFTTTSMSVTWTSVSGATSYEVRYKASGAGSYSSAGTGLASPATITGLTAGTTYDIVVVASNASGSSQSSSTSAPTLPSAPSTPTFGTVTTTSVQVQWSAVTGAAASGTGGYEVFYGTSSGSITTSGGTTYGTSLTVSGLSAGTTYWFTVKAGNASGWSAASTSASKITLPTQVGTVTPTASGDNVALSWSAITSATSYKVEYKTSASSSWTTFGTVYTTSATVTGLVELTAYNFRVSATNASGTGAVSSTASSTTLQYATGGTETTYTAGGVTYRVHTFNSSGTFTLNASRTVDYMIVGGGGGGGGGGFVNNLPAGGGAGGAGGTMRIGNSVALSAAARSVTVGAGGNGGAASNGTNWNGDTGSRGGSSSFNGVSAGGGWGGMGGALNYNGTWTDSFAGEYGGSNDDYGGGTRFGYGAGGGAGAGAAGSNSFAYVSWDNAWGGPGGDGVSTYITGSWVTYGGGGGGGTRHPGSDPVAYHDASQTYRDGGSGGAGGGGAGASGYVRQNGQNGTTNLGGGGGGGRAHGTWTFVTAGNGGNGGSGVVIIRYAI